MDTEDTETGSPSAAGRWARGDIPATGKGGVTLAAEAMFLPRTEKGNTKGMKTAVTIPDPLFAGAERLAKRLKCSRSHMYAQALAEYVARHAPDERTSALNQACDAAAGTEDHFSATAGRRTLRKSKW